MKLLYGYLPDKVKNQIAHKRMLLEQRYSSAGALTDSTSWGWQDLGALWVPLEYEVFGAIVWELRAGLRDRQYSTLFSPILT